jgi:hypothetical protein
VTRSPTPSTGQIPGYTYIAPTTDDGVMLIATSESGTRFCALVTDTTVEQGTVGPSASHPTRIASIRRSTRIRDLSPARRACGPRRSLPLLGPGTTRGTPSSSSGFTRRGGAGIATQAHPYPRAAT